MIDVSIPIHRRSIRLREYDYSSPGAYFVTVVAYQRQYLFGEVVNEEMRLNQYGKFVAFSWEWLPKRYPYVYLDPYIVMPNHFHAILHILDMNSDCRGGSRLAPTKIKPLGQLIGAFKTISAKNINVSRGTPGQPVWQWNYYEHIIRNQLELEDIAGYINMNPYHWSDDPEHKQ
jgi:REP element-mobilizing transposase RayT